MVQRIFTQDHFAKTLEKKEKLEKKVEVVKKDIVDTEAVFDEIKRCEGPTCISVKLVENTTMISFDTKAEADVFANLCSNEKANSQQRKEGLVCKHPVDDKRCAVYLSQEDKDILLKSTSADFIGFLQKNNGIVEPNLTYQINFRAEGSTSVLNHIKEARRFLKKYGMNTSKSTEGDKAVVGESDRQSAKVLLSLKEMLTLQDKMSEEISYHLKNPTPSAPSLQMDENPLPILPSAPLPSAKDIASGRVLQPPSAPPDFSEETKGSGVATLFTKSSAASKTTEITEIPSPIELLRQIRIAERDTTGSVFRSIEASQLVEKGKIVSHSYKIICADKAILNKFLQKCDAWYSEDLLARTGRKVIKSLTYINPEVPEQGAFGYLSMENVKNIMKKITEPQLNQTNSAPKSAFKK